MAVNGNSLPRSMQTTIGHSRPSRYWKPFLHSIITFVPSQPSKMMAFTVLVCLAEVYRAMATLTAWSDFGVTWVIIVAIKDNIMLLKLNLRVPFAIYMLLWKCSIFFAIKIVTYHNSSPLQLSSLLFLSSQMSLMMGLFFYCSLLWPGLQEWHKRNQSTLQWFQMPLLCLIPHTGHIVMLYFSICICSVCQD